MLLAMGDLGRNLRRFAKGLSARLLVLTIFFVMLSEVLIYVPSISRFRLTYLQERIDAAHLASLALKATPDNMISEELEQELLRNARVRNIVIKTNDRRTLMLSEGMPPDVDATFDIRLMWPSLLIRDAFVTLAEGDRVIRVLGPLPDGSEGDLDVILDERDLHAAMLTYSTNILQLSIIISLLTAGLVYLALQLLMIRPMRRITASMVAFRKAPENEGSAITESGRRDEIGTAERELRHMQDELRAALRQRSHLAALGAAVSKIHHDLRNMLATAQLVTDSLATVEDPKVRRIAPRLMQSIDRAIDLCTQTMNYGRADEQPPQRQDVCLSELVDDVGAALGLPDDNGLRWQNQIGSEISVNADREQLFRVLLNLGRNAVEAMPQGGEVALSAWQRNGQVVIEIADSGPGLPEKAREHLFEPFTGSARSGGTGLGLAIARELVEGHGGDLTLAKSDGAGTTFAIALPGKPS